MRRIFIFGMGGMARETADIAAALDLEPWLVAANEEDRDRFGQRYPAILEEEISEHRNSDFAIGIGDGAVRHAIAKRHGELRFPNLIHPSVTLGRGQGNMLAERRGNILCAGARLTCDIALGDFCILNLNSTINHDCVIGNFVTLSPGATIAGNVRLGPLVLVGAGAVINQGTSAAPRFIGKGCVVGSGAVVTSDCAPDARYAGVPARRLP